MANENPPTYFDIHYRKSEFFRTIHVDGIIGASSPRGVLNMAVFSERTPLPTLSRIPVKDNIPGTEEIVASKSGALRELEANLSMDLNVALNLHSWLGQQIELIKNYVAMSQEAAKNNSEVK